MTSKPLDECKLCLQEKKLINFARLLLPAVTLSFLSSCSSSPDVPTTQAHKSEVDRKSEQASKRDRRFKEELARLLKKLPASARIAIPDFETDVAGMRPEDRSRGEKLVSAMEYQRDVLEADVTRLGFTVVDRSALKKTQGEWALQRWLRLFGQSLPVHKWCLAI